jgi:hypothetical protein
MTPLSGSAPLTVTFDSGASYDSDGEVVTILWDFGPGQGQGTASVMSHDYASPGTYAVTLTVTDNLGLSASSSTVLTVSAPPAPPAPVLRLPAVLTLTSRLSIDYPSGYSINHFEWLFIPVENSAAPASWQDRAAFGAPSAGSVGWFSAGPNTDLSLQPLKAGAYQVSLTVVDTFGRRVASNLETVTLVSADLNGVNVYPNPWRREIHEGFPVTFDRLSAEVDVKIFTVSGRLVRNLGRANGRVTWDLRTDSGDAAASGLYIYLITDNQGGKSRGKLALIR